MIDQHWKEHLLNLDHLRQGINLRAFGQKDPLNEYKTEAFSMFQEMLESMRETITQTLCLVEINVDEHGPSLRMTPDEPSMTLQEGRSDPALSSGEQTKPIAAKPTPQKRVLFDQDNPETWGKTPRNAPCPCKSGKKYKQCHGKIT